MKQFKYRRPLPYLTPNKIIVCRRSSRVDLYLRKRKMKSLFLPDCLIITRIGFNKEHIAHSILSSHWLKEP